MTTEFLNQSPEAVEGQEIKYVEYCPYSGEDLAKFTVTDGHTPVKSICHAPHRVTDKGNLMQYVASIIPHLTKIRPA